VGATSPTQNDNYCNTNRLFTLTGFVVYEKVKEKLPSFLVISVLSILHAEHAGARKANP
jgi:hypothetical protein